RNSPSLLGVCPQAGQDAGLGSGGSLGSGLHLFRALYACQGNKPWTAVHHGHELRALPQVRSGELAIYFGGGTITQVPGDGSVHYWGVLGGPSGAANMEGAEGELAQILLRQKVRPWWANRRRVNAWDLELSPKVSWSLEQRLAHCTGSLDLRGIPVETRRLTVLNSQVTIYVDRALDLHLTALGSQVNLIVPPDLALSPGGQRLQFLGSNNLAEFTAPGGSLRLHWEGFLSSLAVERQRGSDSPG